MPRPHGIRYMASWLSRYQRHPLIGMSGKPGGGSASTNTGRRFPRTRLSARMAGTTKDTISRDVRAERLELPGPAQGRWSGREMWSDDRRVTNVLEYAARLPYGAQA